MPIFEDIVEERRRPVADRTMHRRNLVCLPAQERAMLESLWDGQTSYTKLARLLGVDRGTLIRRLRVLQFRLGELRNCLLIDHLNDLPPDFRPVAVDHFVRGLTTRCIAETRGLSRIVVRTMLAYVRGYLNALDKSSAAS